jgi:V-type H+-transporting ATPase subunit H
LIQSTNLEDPISLLTSTVLTSLLASSAAKSPKGTPTADKALPKLLSYLSNLAKSSDGGLQDIAVLEYSALLRGKKAREIFWAQRSETVGPLIEILKAAAGVSNSDSSSSLWSGAASIRTGLDGSLGGGVGLQLLYHVLLAIWQLSFEGATIGEGLEEYAPVPSCLLGSYHPDIL